MKTYFSMQCPDEINWNLELLFWIYSPAVRIFLIVTIEPWQWYELSMNIAAIQGYLWVVALIPLTTRPAPWKLASPQSIIDVI